MLKTVANEALSTDTPATVTFDTLSATKELKETGLEDRQAEAVVSTISKAMSETVATKADLELQSAVTKADSTALGTELKAEVEALKTDLQLFQQSVDSRFEKVDLRFDALEQSLVTIQDRIIIRLGGLMVTMTFLLLAIGPFYIRWVMSLMDSS